MLIEDMPIDELDDDGAIVIDVCGGKPAMLAAATGESVTFSMVVSLAALFEFRALCIAR